MFELGKALVGSAAVAAPAFRLARGATHGFQVSVLLRSLADEVERFPLGRPVRTGRFFWLPMELSVDDQTAVQDYVEVGSPGEVHPGCYWEYLGVGAESALGLMANGIIYGQESFTVATRQALPVGYPIDWVYLFDLSARDAVEVVDVDCLGQRFAPAIDPGSPVAGEWALAGNELRVYGSELNQLRDVLMLTSSFQSAAEPASYWVEFLCDWLLSMVVEQITSFGQVFAPAENPFHPMPGEYLIAENRLYLFSRQSIFPPPGLAEPVNGLAPGAQFLGVVSG